MLIIKLIAITITTFIIPFVVLILSGKLSMDNVIDYICTALAILASVIAQYFVLFLKKGRLTITGETVPRFEGCSIFYQNYYLSALENDIHLISVSISCKERCECYLRPNIKVPCWINESTSSEKFDIELKPKSGEQPKKIEIICIYKVRGENKERKVKNVITKKEEKKGAL